MWKKTRHFTYPFAAFLFVLYVLISFNEAVVNLAISEIPEQGKVLSATVSVYDDSIVKPEELISSYQGVVKTIFSELEYLSGVDQVGMGVTNQVRLNELKADILDQSVPKIYLDLHLEFFGITNKLLDISLQESTENNFSDIWEALDNIKNEFAWI